MPRLKIAAANWKMNLSIMQGTALVREITAGLPEELSCDVVIAPPLTHLDAIGKAMEYSRMNLGAQHCHAESSGAFTGEVSVEMLKELGVGYVITGHSERRQIFGESNQLVKAKVDAILRGGLVPIFCCGEPLALRQADQHREYVLTQLKESLFHLPSGLLAGVVIAYEPIWAIGTGVTASPEQAQEMHAYIRQALLTAYDPETADQIRILYGGSIKADNASKLFSQPDVDGGLVGGASLQSGGFLEIIRAACG